MKFLNSCQRFEKTCGTCGYCCPSDDYVACDNWIPCRGGHPSTPNVCEGYYSKYDDYPLVVDEVCRKCTNNLLEG